MVTGRGRNGDGMVTETGQKADSAVITENQIRKYQIKVSKCI